MKLTVLLFGLIAYSSAVPQPKSLSSDFSDILTVFEWDKLYDILLDHIKDDGAVNAVVTYMQTDKFHELLYEIQDHPSYKKFEEYLAGEGITLEDVIETIHNFIESLTPGTVDEDGSLGSFIEDIANAVDQAALIAVIKEKYENSAEFQEFYKQISSDDMRTLVEDVRQIDEFKHVEEVLKHLDCDVDGFFEALYNLFGWSRKLVLSL